MNRLTRVYSDKTYVNIESFTRYLLTRYVVKGFTQCANYSRKISCKTSKKTNLGTVHYLPEELLQYVNYNWSSYIWLYFNPKPSKLFALFHANDSRKISSKTVKILSPLIEHSLYSPFILIYQVYKILARVWRFEVIFV